MMRMQRISSDEAAEFLGLNPRTLKNWRHLDRRELPYYKVGRRVIYDLQDLTNFLASRRVGQPQEKVSA
jgi:excisionase family DNA binding protein